MPPETLSTKRFRQASGTNSTISAAIDSQMISGLAQQEDEVPFVTSRLGMMCVRGCENLVLSMRSQPVPRFLTCLEWFYWTVHFALFPLLSTGTWVKSRRLKITVSSWSVADWWWSGPNGCFGTRCLCPMPNDIIYLQKASSGDAATKNPRGE